MAIDAAALDRSASSAVRPTVKADIWSDIVCPFCYLGKRRLDAAAKEVGVDLDVTWRAFELDPSKPAQMSTPLVDYIAKKYNISLERSAQSQESIARQFQAEGATFNWRAAKPGNTLDAHRVAAMAQERGLGDKAQARLMKAYFEDGLPIGDRETVIKLAGDIGLPQDEVREMLNSHLYIDEVRRDEQFAHEQLNVQGVPFFVLDEKYALSGAQPVETFARVLRKALEARPAASVAAADGAVCGPDGCAI
jgi:predicted DsbA family dithiol-disulfide isomerase